jgi:arylsulfatase A-like enzyme
MEPRQRFVVLAAIWIAFGCMDQRSDQSVGSESGRPNVLLITVDTLRPDHLSGYGYERATSPGLDALLETAVVFEDAQANSGWTVPSLASIMTSLHPTTHGSVGFRSRLDESHVTLAEMLRANGYRTHGIGSHTFLRVAGGLQQGFDSFDDELIDAPGRTDRHVSSDQISDRAIRWLEAQALTRADDAPRPWLLWLHYFDPHTAYVLHGGVSERFGSGRPSDLYDGEIAFTDLAIARVLERVDDSTGGRPTLVVFTSDHGEAFGEHGLTTHSSNLFAEVTRIPFAIRDPRFAPRRVATPVESLDLLPTLLDLLGIETETPLAGRSLVAAMRGEALPERAILAETEMSQHYVADSLTAGRWKLIADRSGALVRSSEGVVRLRARSEARGAPAEYLFDRIADPRERLDVSLEHPDVVDRLRGKLDQMLATAEARRRGFEASGVRELSPEETEALRALGYLRDDDPAVDAR